jgi:hypothetical protein
MKQMLTRVILSSKITSGIYYRLKNKKFPGSAAYWENRYVNDGNSGQGSYGMPSNYKAKFLNEFVEENNIQTVIEFGCGDGNQLKQFRFPFYVGLDVSPQAIKKCVAQFKSDTTKSFFLYDQSCFADNANKFSADMALSLDVVYHLVEDDVFEKYMHCLFHAATRYAIIYAWDTEGKNNFHVRHRKFTDWIERNIPNFNLVKVIENTTNEPVCDFFIYERQPGV